MNISNTALTSMSVFIQKLTKLTTNQLIRLHCMLADMTAWLLTFTLKTLSEKALEQFLAQLADGRSRIVVYNQRVRHFDPTCILLLHPQWPPTPGLGAASTRLLLIGWWCRGRSFKDWTVHVGRWWRQWGIWHLKKQPIKNCILICRNTGTHPGKKCRQCRCRVNTTINYLEPPSIIL